MPALARTETTGRITWLGRITDKPPILYAHQAQALFAAFAGVEGEVHAGLTRPSCTRVTQQYPVGTTIRNTRQFSIISAEELAEIAAAMGLKAIDPAQMGATMVVTGIPDFTHVPPSSRLQGASGATLVVDLENRPCSLPARAIDVAHPGFSPRFKPAAVGRRGVTAWVEREGWFTLNDEVRLHVPDQRAWRGKFTG